jgi:hypothetical protein
MPIIKHKTLWLPCALFLASCGPSSLLSGQQTHYFDKPGMTTQSFSADKLACVSTVQDTRVFTREEANGLMDILVTCMQARGYTVHLTQSGP